MTTPARMDPDTDPVAQYVRTLSRALRGPARVRHSMLTEVRDGLEDAAAAYRDGGLPPHDAAVRAVRDFGTVPEIAPEYQVELTARQGRRTAFLLAVAFPGMMLAWDLLWSNGISWQAVAGAAPPPAIVSALARLQDATSIGVGALELLLFAATFHRAAPARRIGLTVALTAIAGALLTLVTSGSMHLVSAEAADVMLAAGPVAPTAYVVSVGMLALVVWSASRTLRLARLRPPSQVG
ncbi:permease prefix domain 1-containing protein [Pseudonocardia sp. GCM10023141]|uniref:permease prefix domain 1-containing protein n=1 Tax=Pseudonocardia sp. GCM10023141 TaxID=3252653 RepID=UPI00361B8260